MSAIGLVISFALLITFQDTALAPIAIFFIFVCFARLFLLWIQCLADIVNTKSGWKKAKWLFCMFAGGLLAPVVYYYEESREYGRFKEKKEFRHRPEEDKH